ncbi:MAG TPA: hypothetical protein VFZ09_12015 [Archangium sp.]|uniref:hypothetical protein n=1 Tax=Archangium sp. TaxID=1872627 RepID=UPI002E37ADF4|nr:hypothetical protein [Archangium sp.]HEX5746961.1 hypothetical protein [Archangium sp.]
MSQTRLQFPHALVLAVRLTCLFMVPGARVRAASLALVLASLMGSGRVWASGPPSWSGRDGQRTCSAVQCPLVALPVGALFPVWRQAELCIQEIYNDEHQENVVSRNKEWLSYTGIRPEQIRALRCLKKEGFTGKSGMAAGEPDLWDFTERTMYEITTPSGVAFRKGKLAVQLELANDICSKMECGGVTFRPGSWFPKGPCYALGGALYMRVENVSGVLVYHALMDGTKEAALATTLTTLAALLKSGLLQRFAGALGQRLGSRVVPGYAVASAMAVIILLESGRAEARVGFGGDEPLAALFKLLEHKGTPVPPEIRQMLENEPTLKRAVEDAMTGKKGLTRAQKELNGRVLQIIKDNQERSSAEDLSLLLGMTRLAGSALPASDVTVQTLQNALEAKKAGKSGSGNNADRGRSGGLSTAAKAKIDDAPEAKRKVFDALFSRTSKDRPVLTDDALNLFLSIVPPDLSDGEVSVLVSRLQPWVGGSVADVLAGLTTAVAELRLPDTGAKLPEAVTDGTIGTGAAPPDSRESSKELMATLASVVRLGDYSRVEEGTLYFESKRNELETGSTLTKPLLTILGGKRLAALVTFKVTGTGDDWVQVMILGSSVWVDADQNPWGEVDELVSNEPVRLFWYDAQKK